MNIDGENTLACTKAIEDIEGDVAIYPLPHMEVIRDLVVDFTGFWAQYEWTKPWLQTYAAAAGQGAHAVGRGARQARRPLRVHPVRLLHHRPARPTGGTATSILGPAALLQSYRWLIDSRDEATGERLEALEDPYKLYRCHTIMNCANTCPKGLNPAKAIAEIKKMVVERKL